jgi:hypothetical protein
VGITQSPEPSRPAQPAGPTRPAGPGRPEPGHASAFVTGGVYALLLVLGLLEGTIGSFQYSRGPAPLASILFGLAILVTCALGGWFMEGMPGALLPAIGWFVASFGLAMPDSGGSVIIANTHAGEWYLYGGSVCALLGVATALIPAARRSSPRRNRTSGGGVPPA